MGFRKGFLWGPPGVPTGVPQRDPQGVPTGVTMGFQWGLLGVPITIGVPNRGRGQGVPNRGPYVTYYGDY